LQEPWHTAQPWAHAFDALFARIAPRIARQEARDHAKSYLHGLLSPVEVLLLRKANAKRQPAKELAKTIRRGRKRIETTFSQIMAKIQHRLRPVTPSGFEGKVLALFVAFAIWCVENEKQQTADG